MFFDYLYHKGKWREQFNKHLKEDYKGVDLSFGNFLKQYRFALTAAIGGFILLGIGIAYALSLNSKPGTVIDKNIAIERVTPSPTSVAEDDDD